MDSDKIVQLAISLMEMTSSEEITWHSLIDPPLLGNEPNSGIDSVELPNPLELVSRITSTYNGLMFGHRTIENPWERFIYSSSPVEDKVFRLNGIVYKNGNFGRVRLQLWNTNETKLLCEFPENSSFDDLFRIVHNFDLDKADEFVDRFLEKRNQIKHRKQLVAAH